jgi:hypothetical protein
MIRVSRGPLTFEDIVNGKRDIQILDDEGQPIQSEDETKTKQSVDAQILKRRVQSHHHQQISQP